ncbi:hypothetical protein MSG28_008761 [Choristoneura fumiferana]|uniref:Uncharacterized protein n=1 Tax=Choristoneura fumiferana TaxID=7141 RepID=A0ACC0J7Y0_CHOFU|nr:hypothetical protein MSG28_008761 [Choristoneura fumiferana]
MTEYIAGFIAAIVLSALLVLWLIYCMFVRERHKRHAHYSIGDIIKRNQELELQANAEITPEKKSGLSAGIFILPTRHRHKDDYDYEKRPDYPESRVPMPLQLSTDKLVEFCDDNDDFYKDGTLEIGSNATYISDV